MTVQLLIRPRRTGAFAQLRLFLAAYVLYNLGRYAAVGDLNAASDHARWIMDVERGLGVSVEGTVQGALNTGILPWLMSHVYLAAQLVVLPGTLIWLYRRSPGVYRRLRDTVLTTWMIALPIYALYPVAPPRLADVGLADTVSEQAAVGLTGRSSVLYNSLAAVPSLHCGFALAVGIAMAFAVRSRTAKILWLLWGPLVCLTVLATGNHYVFDIAAGLLVAAVGYLAGRLPGRLGGRLRARLPRRRQLVVRLKPRRAMSI
jgi:membrane-associated phospholipid phosphatase